MIRLFFPTLFNLVLSSTVLYQLPLHTLLFEEPLQPLHFEPPGFGFCCIGSSKCFWPYRNPFVKSKTKKYSQPLEKAHERNADEPYTEPNRKEQQESQQRPPPRLELEAKQPPSSGIADESDKKCKSNYDVVQEAVVPEERGEIVSDLVHNSLITSKA